MSNYTLINSQTDKLLFSWIDYTIFAIMLILSALIGVYIGFFGKKQDSTAEYILGGKTMKTFPVAVSLVASFISGITLLGVPADVYIYGASYWWSVVSLSFTALLTCFVYLPVFAKLQLTSSYEYLKLRFDPSLRVMSSFLFALTMLLYLPIVIYIPALAFSQVSDVNIHMITPIVCVVCIFYTTVGGLKAVVWTDTLQFVVMLITMVVILIMGIKSAFGLSNIMKVASEGGRLDLLVFNVDPTDRTSFWAIAIGQTFAWTSYIAVSQNFVQKFMSMPSLTNCRWALVLFFVGCCSVKSVSVLTGLIMYTRYSHCDPLTTGSIKKPDQLLPYFIMDVAGHVVGLPGLFIAGTFCAALSTMSAGLNTLSGTIYEDFIKPLMPKGTTEKTASNIMKCLVLVLGVFCTAMVFIVEHLGNVTPLSLSFGGMASGPLLGMFTLGMLVPFANTKGTLTGATSGIIVMGWIVFGTQYHISQGGISSTKLPVYTDACNFTVETLNSTTTNYLPLYPYRISFYYYGLIGLFVTMFVGIVISLATGGRNQKVNPELLSPIIRRWLPKYESYQYTTVELSNKILRRNSLEEKQNMYGNER